ncbi:ComEC/Rec2 family competence protein, partial [candidate division KSB1 bacterium]|nr:ComEC/Rec2 family competence protein [candidate division KSB1 bacterium]
MLNNRPGLRIAVYFAIGIFAASYPGFSFYRTIGLLAFIVVLFLGLSYFAKSSTASHAFLFLLVFTAGYGRMSINSYELLPRSHLLNLDIFDTEIMLSGWIKDRRDYSSGNSTITVAILSLQSGNRRYAPVEGDINISLPFSSAGDRSDDGGKDSYSYGDEVTASGTLVRPPARRNPGEFDYRSYLERNGIYGQLRRSSGSLLEIKDSNYGNLLVREVVVPVRDALSSTLSNFHSGQYLEFMRAILLGQRSGMEPEIMEDFKDTGTLHILAVSGLHIGFVAVLLFGILRVFPFSRPVVLSMMIIAIFLYIFVTGAKPPVMRAGIYLIVYCFGIITQRLRDPLNILGITVVILLLINPADLFDAGFQLSVFSILGIMFLTNYFRSGLDNYTGLKNYMRNKWDDIFRRNLFRVGFLLIVSIGAFLGTSVVMAYHFHRLMPGGIVLSLIIVPAASIIVGLGFIEIIIGSIIPVVGNAIKTSIELLINGIFWLNRNAADLPGVNFTVGQNEIIWVVISITLAIVSIAVFSPDKRNRIKINSSGNRHRLKIISGFAVVLVIWGMWWTRTDGLMRVQFLDVGQGDAAVVSFPDGTHFLIDGGDNRDGWDSGKRHIMPFLRWAGIRQLDGVFLSHPNRDHY